MFALQIDDWETEVDVKAKSDVPVFISHGKNDQMMPIDTAKMSYDHLKSKGIQFELFEENDLEHSLSMTTIANMKKFFHNHMVWMLNPSQLETNVKDSLDMKLII